MSGRVLVTGACGAIGTNLVELLVQQGTEVRATDLESPTGVTVASREQVERCGATFIPSDLTRPETLDRVVKGVDAVFHLASIFNYATPWEAMERVNVQGTRNLCEAIARSDPKTRLIHWSSGEVYGFGMMDAAALPPDGELTEEAPQAPGESPYAKSKQLQEQVVWEYHREKGLPATVLRLASVYGPGTMLDTLFFFLVHRGILQAFPRHINLRWPLVHVQDVIRSSVHLAGRKEAVGQAYNIVDDQNYTVADVIHSVALATGNRLYALPIPIRMSKVTGITKLALPIAKMDTLRRIRAVKKRGKKPTFETFTIEAYMDVLRRVKRVHDDFRYSNRKLKATGYTLRYPDYRHSVHETADWYRQRRYI
ncbi:MAG: NAD(P)-dependent oxidoreductase [Euryarchaeota archaeon]|nr:NAD(P)-dependent oxidoreductase [Euryarchaeota archaeon]